MLERSKIAMTIGEQAAITAYEVQRTYLQGLGDDTRPPWGDLCDVLRDHSVFWVHMIMQDPTWGTLEIHNAFYDHLQAFGWEWGDDIDAEKRTHPYFMAYDELNPHNRMGLEIFTTAAQGVLAYHTSLGFGRLYTPEPTPKA